MVEEGRKTHDPNQTNHRKYVCDEEKAKEDKLAYELQLRYTGLQYEVDHRDILSGCSEFWPDEPIRYTYMD